MSARQNPRQEKNVYDNNPQDNAYQQGRCNHPFIFLGGIQRQITRNHVLNYVKQFGEVRYFALPFEREKPDSHKGFAKLQFFSANDTASFLSIPKHKIKEHEIGVSEWVAKTKHVTKHKNSADFRLFFTYKSKILDSDIFTYFSNFGTVKMIDMKSNYKTKENGDFGFVTFKAAHEVDRILEAGNAHFISGKRIVIFPNRPEDCIQKTQFKSSKKTVNVNLDSSNIVAGPSYRSREIVKKEHIPYITSTKDGLQLPESDTKMGIQLLQTGSLSLLENNLLAKRQQILLKSQYARNCSDLKPTSSRWQHLVVSDRHLKSNLLFRTLKCSYPR